MSDHEMDPGRIKFVMTGDAGVGKSAFLTTWAIGDYPHEYITAIFCSWSTSFKSMNGRVYVATPWDTFGAEEKSSSVPGVNKLSYVDATLFIYTYSVADFASFEHVMRWVQETREVCPEAPCVLFGLKRDMRDNSLPGAPNQNSFVTTNQGKDLAAGIGAKAFLELSALTDPYDVINKAMTKVLNIAAEYADQKEQKTSDNNNDDASNTAQKHDKRGK